MEHNAYAIWKGLVKYHQDIREHVTQDETRLVGRHEFVKEFRIVAPKGDLGRALLKIYFDKYYKYGFIPLPNGNSHEIVGEPEEQELHGVIRYDDEYRGRM